MALPKSFGPRTGLPPRRRRPTGSSRSISLGSVIKRSRLILGFSFFLFAILSFSSASFRFAASISDLVSLNATSSFASWALRVAHKSSFCSGFGFFDSGLGLPGLSLASGSWGFFGLFRLSISRGRLRWGWGALCRARFDAAKRAQFFREAAREGRARGFERAEQCSPA